MRRIIFFLIFFISIVFQSFSQQIESKKVFGGYKFTQNHKKLNYHKMSSIMENNNEAYNYMKFAKNSKILGEIIAFAGGYFIGSAVSDVIHDDPALKNAIISVGIIGLAIPFSAKANKNALKAVDIYNTGLNKKTSNFQPKFKLGVSNNKIGMVVVF